MRISLISAWNTDSGSGIHAEFIAREWIKMGHKVSVFSFIKSDFHGKNFLREDEPYVTRCFGTPRTNFLDPRPIIKTPLDILVVEDLGMLPKDKLAKIFPNLKEKVKATINIIHDNELSSDPSYYQFDWDKVIVFDERYKEIFKEVYSKKEIEIIPYPCTFLKKGDKEKARDKLNLPKNKKIIFTYGWWVKGLIPFLPIFPKINQKWPLYFLIVTREKSIKKEYLELENEEIEIDFREKFVTLEELFDYLHASDALVLGDKTTTGPVISSSALMSIGAGTPIVMPRSNFSETFKDEVLKYSNSKELKENIFEVFEKKEKYKKTIKAAEDFVKKNNPKVIAEKYIKLFEKIKRR